MRLTALLVALALTGCVSQEVAYTPRGDARNPEAVIEQVLMEQDEDRRPDYVRTTREYVEYGRGATTKFNEFTDKTTAHRNVTRLYFRSVATEKVYTKRNNVIVQFRNSAGTLLAQVVTDNLDSGRRLVDAVETMKGREH
ncbi:hypothetical protein [Paraburkholderia caffeinilytica]|uniref:hypothetical protein n=1 Tax=Paraburkholderia caffeinilytica TaxID=1761016 RepID=UPI0038BD4323